MGSPRLGRGRDRVEAGDGVGCRGGSWAGETWGELSAQGLRAWARVLGLPAPSSVPPWPGRTGSTEARAAMTQDRDLGAAVGWAGHSLPWSPCFPFPKSGPRDMLGAPSPRTPHTQNWAPWPSTLLSQSTVASRRDRMEQLPGVRLMGRCSAPASPAASTGVQALGGHSDSGRPWGRTSSADGHHPAPLHSLNGGAPPGPRFALVPPSPPGSALSSPPVPQVR